MILILLVLYFSVPIEKLQYCVALQKSTVIFFWFMYPGSISCYSCFLAQVVQNFQYDAFIKNLMCCGVGIVI